MREIKLANQTIINQLCSFLNQVSNQDYAQKLNILSGSSIGMHVRHILEFYNCLLVNHSEGEICYDKRERKLIYELDPTFAQTEFQVIIKKINTIQKNTLITLKVNPNKSIGSSETTKSFLARELLYLMDHTIHHMALIKIGINNNIPSINLDKTFGIAPSTLRHQKEKCAQ